ncbi:hypothetical protein VE04_07368 [Pseudogymnoascus sp. 24MN13]|nr:hypothetical protein VE04_07368 [Pseudogymnoascus sp. 24MN13]
MNRSNTEYPSVQYPQNGEDCWALGGRWYQEWKYINQNMETTSREYGRLRPDAENALRRIDREVMGSQQQRAISRQYADVLERYGKVKAILNRNEWLKRSMKGLGNHMRRNALLYKDDVPTFPLNM